MAAALAAALLLLTMAAATGCGTAGGGGGATSAEASATTAAATTTTTAAETTAEATTAEATTTATTTTTKATTTTASTEQTTATSAATATQSLAPAAQDSATNAKHNDTLRVSYVTSFTTTDPHYVAQNADSYLNGLLYESLFSVDSRTKELTPRLAESYDVSPDGLTYTFHLLQGVQWQTGGEFKASDALYSYKRAQESPYMAGYLAPVADIAVADDYTLVFTLSQLSPTFYIDVNRVSILSEEATKDFEPGFSNKIPGGTGPYTVTKWSPDQQVVVTRNPTYHGAPAPIGTIELNVFGDSNAEIRAFEANEIDYVNVPMADWDRIQSSGKYKTAVEDTITTLFFLVNNERAPFDNPLVRQAFSYAVNKDDILWAAQDGNGSIQSSLGNSTLVFGIPGPGEITEYGYDPEKAKALLAEAGYPDGIQLETHVVEDSTAVTAVVALQEQMKASGIELEINLVDQATYVSIRSAGEVQCPVLTWYKDIADPDNFTYTFYHSTSSQRFSSNWNDPKTDEMLARGRASMGDERTALYVELEEYLVNEQSIVVPLYNPIFYYLKSPDVQGLWFEDSMIHFEKASVG